jgi:hypothetical protein
MWRACSKPRSKASPRSGATTARASRHALVLSIAKLRGGVQRLAIIRQGTRVISHELIDYAHIADGVQAFSAVANGGGKRRLSFVAFQRASILAPVKMDAPAIPHGMPTAQGVSRPC